MKCPLVVHFQVPDNTSNRIQTYIIIRPTVMAILQKNTKAPVIVHSGQDSKLSGTIQLKLLSIK